MLFKTAGGNMKGFDHAKFVYKKNYKREAMG